jgi:hypothetical protein
MELEPEPLVIVENKFTYQEKDKRGGRSNLMIPACFYALIAHRPGGVFEYSYERNVRNPLECGQKLPPRANVVTDYKAPSKSDCISLQSPHELHVDLFRLLIHRYSMDQHLVMGLPMGTGNMAIAALWEKRRFVGIDENAGNRLEALRRCYKTHLRYRLTFGINKGVMPDRDQLPEGIEPGDHVPANMRDVPHNPEDELEVAKLNALEYALEIKQSQVPGAGNGLWARRVFEQGQIIGYYWGHIFFDRDSVRSNRVMATSKKRLKNNQLELMYIDGSRCCYTGYTNDPRGSARLFANAQFEEADFDARPPAEGELTSPPIWMIMKLVAKVEIPMGAEILASYSHNYHFEESNGSSPTDSSEAESDGRAGERGGPASSSIAAAGSSIRVDNGGPCDEQGTADNSNE